MNKKVTPKKLTKKEIAKRKATIDGSLYTDADVKRYIGVVSNNQMKT